MRFLCYSTVSHDVILYDIRLYNLSPHHVIIVRNFGLHHDAHESMQKEIFKKWRGREITGFMRRPPLLVPPTNREWNGQTGLANDEDWRSIPYRRTPTTETNGCGVVPRVMSVALASGSSYLVSRNRRFCFPSFVRERDNR